MKRLEIFTPEEGDRLVLSHDFPESGLHVGDIVEFVNSTPMGIVCKYVTEPGQTLIPQSILKGILGNKVVELAF